MTAPAPAAPVRGTAPVLTAGAARLLFFCLLTAGMGQSFLFAVWPPLGREIGFSDIQIGMVITATGLVFMVSAPIWGQVSEVWGRRPSIVTGLIVFALTTAGFAVVVGLRQDGSLGFGLAFGLLIALRACFAAGGAAVFPSAQAYIADMSPPDRRAANLTIIGTSFGLGMVAGPAMAAALAGVALLAPFYGIAAMALTMAVLVRLLLPVPPRAVAALGSDGQPLTTPLIRLAPYFLVSMLTMAALAVVQQVTGFRVQDLFGLTAQEAAMQTGLALIAMATTFIAVQVGLVRRLKLQPLTLLRLGGPVMALAFALFLVADTYPLILLVMALFGGSLGLAVPGFAAGASIAAGTGQQGRVAGLLGSFQSLGFVIGPLSGASLYQLAPTAPYVLGLVLASVIGLIGWRLARPRSMAG